MRSKSARTPQPGFGTGVCVRYGSLGHASIGRLLYTCGCRPNRVGPSVEPRNASDRVIWDVAPWIVFWRFQMLVLGPSV
eukprot:4352780-Prymnesium_polylepis.1